MAVPTYTKNGTKAATAAKLDKSVFGDVPANHELIKTAYVAYLANGRTAQAQAKTRGEVSGGGRKPWKQKGTGRARFGSSRNPIWRGGGKAFGPTGHENYTQKLHVAAKRKALRQALSLGADGGKLIVLEDIVLASGKTADAAKLLAKIGAVKNTLLVVADKTPALIRSTGNLSNVKVVQPNYLNVYDVMNADHVIFTNTALKSATTWLNPALKGSVKSEERKS